MAAAITSTRKNTAKPSMTTIPLKAVPGASSPIAAGMSAATRPAIAVQPRARLEAFEVSGSRTMISVAITTSSISGRTRKYSGAVGMKLVGTRHLRGARMRRLNRPDVEAYAHLGGFQNRGRALRDWREEGLGQGSHPHHEHHQREDGGPLAAAEVGHVRGHFRTRVAEEDALVEPQHVAGCEDHADGSARGPAEARLRRALEDQVLAYEVVQHGQAHAGEGGDEEYGREVRRDGRHSTVVCDFERVAALVEVAYEHEEGSSRDAVVQHLVNGAVHPQLGESENAQNDEA